LCIIGGSVNGECPIHGDKAMPVKVTQPSPLAGAQHDDLWLRKRHFFITGCDKGALVTLDDAIAYAKKERERADLFERTLKTAMMCLGRYGRIEFDRLNAELERARERADAVERERDEFGTTIVRLDRALEFRQKECESLRTELREVHDNLHTSSLEKQELTLNLQDAERELRDVLEALEKRQRKGHNDTCANMLSAEFTCDCGYVEAEALLSRKGEGS
jgi:hypothetical protein